MCISLKAQWLQELYQSVDDRYDVMFDKLWCKSDAWDRWACTGTWTKLINVVSIGIDVMLLKVKRHQSVLER